MEPTDRHRASFRKCLRLTFCPHASPHSCSDYQLLQPLGKWFPVKRHIQHKCYRSRDHIYLRDEFGIHKCPERGTTGFFIIPEEIVTDIPLNSHPIEPNYASQTTLWTRKRRQLIRRRQPPSTISVIRDDMPLNQSTPIDLVSDAAVHVERQKGAVCWHAVNEFDQRLCGTKPVPVSDKSYSYRHELVGIYDGLNFTHSNRPLINEYKCHCDNEAGIQKLILPFKAPGELMRPDADVIMAIKQFVIDKSLKVTYHHVKGHANAKKAKEDCNRIEQINIDCDEDADHRVQHGDHKWNLDHIEN